MAVFHSVRKSGGQGRGHAAHRPFHITAEVCLMAQDEPPMWGRGARQYRRGAARELAREVVRTGNQARQSSPKLDVVLWFLAAFMALGLFLLAPKIGRASTIVVLIAMAGCLVHPLWQLPLVQNAQSLTKKIKLFSSFVLLAFALLALFGVYVWPPVRRHVLSEKERQAFQEPLKVQQKGEHEEIQIVCPTSDESTCVYANQFINIFREAGWKVQNNQVERVTLEDLLPGLYCLGIPMEIQILTIGDQALGLGFHPA